MDYFFTGPVLDRLIIVCLNGGGEDPVKKIMVVDDEPAIRDLLRMLLVREGYEVITAVDGMSAVSLVNTAKPDIVVLDLMLPDIDGHEVCKRIAGSAGIPIIMLTAKGDIVDKVLGLELGADDYITKPFEGRELLARIKALLRRSDNRKITAEEVSYRGLYINSITKSVEKNGHQVVLTPRELQLLEVLAKNPKRVFSRDELMSRAWGYDYTGDSRSVDICITRLRKKIEDDAASPQYIVTVYGFGYRFGGL